MISAPKTYMGKRKIFEEHFVAPHTYPSQRDALSKLNAVREGHPASCGWVELDFTLKQISDGSWYVSVHHAKYE